MSDAVGWLAVVGAVIGFGVFSLPTRAFQSGDGAYFQFAMCTGIYLVGAIVHLVQCSTSNTCPTFTSLAALGGGIWCIANLLLVPLVNALGMGRVMLTWGAAEMLTGWATASFGLFGLAKETVARPELNYVGVALGIVSIFILAYAGGDGSAAATIEKTDGTEAAPLLVAVGSVSSEAKDTLHVHPSTGDSAMLDRTWGPGGLPPRSAWPDWHASGYDVTAALAPSSRRAFGIVFCLVAGALSGSTFTPAQYVVDHGADFPGAATNLTGHLFAHFTGIFVTSTLVFVAYASAARNRPWATPPLFLPAFAAGLVWAGAMYCWFIANERLSIVIAFPLVTLGPGIVSMLIGGVFFGEVRGWRSVVGLTAACVTFAGAAACIAVSH